MISSVLRKATRIHLHRECTHTEDIDGGEGDEQLPSEDGHHMRRNFRNHEICVVGIAVSGASILLYDQYILNNHCDELATAKPKCLVLVGKISAT